MCVFHHIPSSRWDVGSSVPHLRWFRWASVAGHLDPHFPPVQYVAVHLVHGVFSVAFVVKPDESESTRLLRETVPGRVDVAHLPVSLEYRQQLLRRDAVGKVVHFQAYHPFNVRRAAVSKARRVRSAAFTVSASASTSVALSAPTATFPAPIAHLLRLKQPFLCFYPSKPPRTVCPEAASRVTTAHVQNKGSKCKPHPQLHIILTCIMYVRTYMCTCAHYTGVVSHTHGCRYRSMKCRRLLLCSCLFLACLGQGDGKKQKKLQIMTEVRCSRENVMMLHC